MAPMFSYMSYYVPFQKRNVDQLGCKYKLVFSYQVEIMYKDL